MTPGLNQNNCKMIYRPTTTAPQESPSMKSGRKKTLAYVVGLALAISTFFNAITSSTYSELYDTLSDVVDVQRRLNTVNNKNNDPLLKSRQHYAKYLMSRGMDRRNKRFKEKLNKKMNRIVGRRTERAGLRKLVKKLNMGHEIWNETPMTVTSAEKRKESGRLLEDELSFDINLQVCNRATNVKALGGYGLLSNKYFTCPKTKSKDVLLLEGMNTFGRTGNNLIEFLHALQISREQEITLGIMTDSWALNLLTRMWMALGDDDWEHHFEESFCVKLFHSEEELEGWNVIKKSTKQLFEFVSDKPYNEYVASTLYSIQTLFKQYNTGEGTDIRSKPVQDMCSGINAIFGDKRSHAVYSVIHSRSLEGLPGTNLLSLVCQRAKCDSKAALEMRPDYVKSILAPLGMMKYPIVLITDGQNFSVLQRLITDPDIGPMLHLVPEEACWVGGDWTLGIMSNVFIGNPASTFSTFIAKSRIALGFGHNYLFRVRNENGEWITSCGDGCVFDKAIMSSMS